MSVFAVPRSTAMALAGKNEPDLKKGQRINCELARSPACRVRRTAREGRCGAAGGTRESYPGANERASRCETDTSLTIAGGESNKVKGEGTSPRPSPLHRVVPASRALRLAVEAVREVRVADRLVVRHRQVHVGPVRYAAIVRATSARKHRGRIAPILPDEPPHVAKALATTERPERLLIELQVHARRRRARIHERRHHGNRYRSELERSRRPQRVQREQPVRDVASGEEVLRLDEPRVDTADDGNRRAIGPERRRGR